MAAITRKQNRDRSVSLEVAVFVKPWRKSRSFCVADYSTRAAAKTAAERWGQEIEAELHKQHRAGVARTDVTTQTLGDVLDAYVKDPETTALRYFREVKRASQWWLLNYGERKVLDLALPLMLREARDKLMPGRAPATVNRHLSVLRSAWNWARAAAVVPAEKVWPTRLLLTEPRARVRYLNDDELGRLLAAAKACSTVMHAAIVVSIATGVRKGELLRLAWSDVDMPRATVRIMESKNGAARSVHLPAAAAAVLKDLKAAPVVSAKHVFVTPKGRAVTWQWLDKAWRKVRTAAKLTDFRWHDLRHTAASYLAQSGASLLEVGNVLGHKSAGVTMRYAHLVAGQALPAHAGLNQKLTDSSKP